MALKQKSLIAQSTALAEQRQVRVVCSTGEIDRDGEIMVQGGLEFGAYRQNPVVLWAHDVRTPIARCLEIGQVGDRTEALVQFPEPGVSAKADEIYGLIAAGVINGVSVGIDPIEVEPVDPAKPRGPLKYLRAELCEFSFVSIPAVRSARVVERAAGHTLHARLAGSLVRKGLWDVASLACIIGDLGWLTESVEWEAAAEQDGSQVPAMLGAALRQLGDALVAMSAEEVAELLAQYAAASAGTPAQIVTAAFQAHRKAAQPNVQKTRRLRLAEATSLLSD